jgi:hypothetical protein
VQGGTKFRETVRTFALLRSRRPATVQLQPRDQLDTRISHKPLRARSPRVLRLRRAPCVPCGAPAGVAREPRRVPGLGRWHHLACSTSSLATLNISSALSTLMLATDRERSGHYTEMMHFGYPRLPDCPRGAAKVFLPSLGVNLLASAALAMSVSLTNSAFGDPISCTGPLPGLAA